MPLSQKNGIETKRNPRHCVERSGGAKEVAVGLKELDQFPLPDESPDHYVDYDETGPYSAEVGDSECAT